MQHILAICLQKNLYMKYHHTVTHVEILLKCLKLKKSGQFSYFTAHPGVTRGDHYHHTKTEKFLVLNGTALFAFRNMDTGESFSIQVDHLIPKVVETIPGWTHNIKNIGSNDLIVMLWVNEIFDSKNPDTFLTKV